MGNCCSPGCRLSPTLITWPIFHVELGMYAHYPSIMTIPDLDRCSFADRPAYKIVICIEHVQVAPLITLHICRGLFEQADDRFCND